MENNQNLQTEETEVKAAAVTEAETPVAEETVETAAPVEEVVEETTEETTEEVTEEGTEEMTEETTEETTEEEPAEEKKPFNYARLGAIVGGALIASLAVMHVVMFFVSLFGG